MRSSPPINSVNALAGWDIGVSAFALACMTAGFWRLLPGSVSLDDAPITALILKAGLASLGFVGVATRWENVLQAWANNPLMLVLLGLACGSTFWAIVPAEALRNAILFIVIWVFGIAMTLRFKPRELAEICAFAGLFGLMAQFAAHQSMPPATAFDGDVAFAILGTAWAAWCVPVRRLMWLLGLGVCCALGLASGDIASLGAVVGLIVGFGVAQVSALRGRQKAISVIVSAWAIVALVIGVTLFALFGVDPVSARVTRFFEALGPQAIIGQGFGLAGGSVASSLGAGLGIVGVATAGLVVFAFLFQALVGDRQNKDGLDANVAIWFACLGAILVSPGDIAMFGPVCIMFAGTSFSISLSCVRAPRQRQSLVQAAVPSQPRQKPKTGPKTGLASRAPAVPQAAARLSDAPLNSLGLRPKL